LGRNRMIEPDFKTLSLRQMHPMQVEALLKFVGEALNLAALTSDKQILRETEAEADELIRLFGGNGIKLTVNSY
jgi:hypothetical protein